MSDELVRAFVLADNKLLERAGWNREILAAELGELSALLASADLGISLTGFEHGKIDVLLADPRTDCRQPPGPRSPAAAISGSCANTGFCAAMRGHARTHSKRKINDLAKAIKAVGFIGVVVVDETGMILAGHARHAAAKLLGMKAIPTICVTGLSDELVRAFVLADNKFSERAGWNREILAAEPAVTRRGDCANTGFCAATRGRHRATPVS